MARRDLATTWRDLRAHLATGRSPQGPISVSMALSLKRATLGAVSVWNLVVAVVIATGDPRIDPVLVVPLQLALAVVTLAGASGRIPFGACLLAAYAVWQVDLLCARSVDDAITLASCWLGDYLYLASVLASTSRSRTWFPLVGAMAVAVTTAAVGSVWSISVTSVFVVTSAAIVLAARVAMPSLWKLAGEADESLEALEHERTAREVARRTGAAAAEDARLVHDTVINTLGAVANGAAARYDPDRMRERCSRDLDVVEGLIRGRRDAGRRLLADIGADEPEVEIERRGLLGRDLEDLEELLPSETLAALVGAAEEAVRNAAKHARVSTVVVEVERAANDVVVTVRDAGVGFVPGPASGRGISGSIHARMQAVGGSATVGSTVGEGTEVRLVASLTARSSGVDAEEAPSTVLQRGAVEAEAAARTLLRRACWLLSGGIVAVGFAIEAANRPGRLTWTYAMLVIVAAATLAAFRFRRRAVAPTVVVAALVLAYPLGFVAALAGIDFGRDQTLTYQAIGTVPPMVVLLVLGRRRAAVLAVGLLGVALVTLVALIAPTSTTRAAVVVVAALPGLGLVLGWSYFEGLVVRIVAASEAARSQARLAAAEVSSRRELEEVRRRWGTASLVRAAALLRGIASGELDVRSSAVREQCSIEERYLRELLLLSPAAYRMAGWFASALAAARARAVTLTIRGGDQDVGSGHEAEALGGLIIAAVDTTPPGAQVSVGWFPSAGGQRLLIVGPQDVAAPSLPELPDSWTWGRTVVADRAVIEVTLG